MIRYKDKEFEEYFIDPVTAVITDKNGVVQPVKIFRGRPTFQNMPVHQIIVHTFFGYAPEYEIHHLDENKLNNALSNLVYLTKGDHTRLHMKGKQKTEEHKAKISAANKGKQKTKEHIAKIIAANKGKHHSDETIEKIAAKAKGKIWFFKNDLSEEKQFFENPGEGWSKGRLPKKKHK